MKTLVVLMISLLTLGAQAQSLIGAWERNYTSEDGEQLKSVVIISDGYQVLTTYNSETGAFIHSNGGTWSLDGDTMTETVEFHTDNSEMVGQEFNFKIILTDSELKVVGDGEGMKFSRIDNGNPGKLNGAWLMSERMRNGELQSRDTSRPRKTMKILSGTRFQWIAYNTETKQFMGTGGGTYTTIDGTYTENIEFFSRDNTRVGASLEFDYSLEDGDWHHKGFSSKGDPLYEIWSIRK
ncbi:membrane or secreted protein [Winogradskyella sp. A3E31]|uniref:membrane or secreted protein n=1 Tax=Winogradskyella sp. A3E31 TaxID=3349637 RepID=UPI00398AFA61